MEKVGIVLVNYNGYQDTIDCLKSLGKITYGNYCVIVVDNGSTNQSFEQLKSYESDSVVVLRERENLGFSGGNNVGIRYALQIQCEYLLLLNNDTIVEPDFLEPLVNCSKRENKCITTSKIMYADQPTNIWYAGGTINPVTSRVTHRGINEKDSIKYNDEESVSFVSGCCMLIPKEVFRDIGELSEEYFLYCEDVDYCCRIIEKGYAMRYCPSSKIYHKVNASSGRNSDLVIYYTIRNKLYLIKKHMKYKVIANIYNILEVLKRLITKEYSLKAIAGGVAAFVAGETGKKEV